MPPLHDRTSEPYERQLARIHLAMTAVTPNAKIRLVHIITGLDTGGAEMMLYKLLSKCDRSRFAPEVICLQPNGVMGERIAGLDVRVRSLDMKSVKGSFTAVRKLAGWLRESRPDIIQTWMYHGDLVGGIAGKIARCRAIIWNIRASMMARGAAVTAS